jgi:hypothetical protein
VEDEGEVRWCIGFWSDKREECQSTLPEAKVQAQGSTVVREDTVLPSTRQFFGSGGGGGHGSSNEEVIEGW